MKVTIDLDKLLKEGLINQDEYDKFSRFSARGTSSLAFNIVVGFGVIMVAGATLALAPSAATAILLGLATFGAGFWLIHAHVEQWRVLANVSMVVGALLFGGGVIMAWEGSSASFLFVAAAFAGAGILARSQLLMVLSVLALASSTGARTAYFHASYFLGIEEPTLTVILFAFLGIGVFQLSKRLTPEYESLAIAASRTGAFLVNFGFWIGSLWGDQIGDTVIDESIFALLWGCALIGAGLWAWRRNRRWLVNVVAVFAAIHFYTQWFEQLGASPATVLLAGLLALGFAFGIRAFNARMTAHA